jgi:hypothetical protein
MKLALEKIISSCELSLPFLRLGAEPFISQNAFHLDACFSINSYRNTEIAPEVELPNSGRTTATTSHIQPAAKY